MCYVYMQLIITCKHVHVCIDSVHVYIHVIAIIIIVLRSVYNMYVQ